MPAAPASDAVPGGVHLPPLETGIQAVWLFAISRGPRTTARSAPSPRPALPRHAAVPSRFPVQVRRAAQRSPPPEPLPLRRRSSAELDGAQSPVTRLFLLSPCDWLAPGPSFPAPVGAAAPASGQWSAPRRAARRHGRQGPRRRARTATAGAQRALTSQRDARRAVNDSRSSSVRVSGVVAWGDKRTYASRVVATIPRAASAEPTADPSA